MVFKVPQHSHMNVTVLLGIFVFLSVEFDVCNCSGVKFGWKTNLPYRFRAYTLCSKLEEMGRLSVCSLVIYTFFFLSTSDWGLE